MVHLHRAGVEWFSLAYTIGALDGTYGPFEKYHGVSQVTSLVPVIISAPEFVVGEEAFSLHSCLFAFDFFQIPPDLVVDRWASDGESGSHRPFLFRYDVWTMFHSQIREKITSALSMA
jgi:hypothetical protein